MFYGVGMEYALLFGLVCYVAGMAVGVIMIKGMKE